MTIEELQAKYDLLVADRSIAIEMYDRSPDGSEMKRTALEIMDRLDAKIVEVEQDIEDALDDEEKRVRPDGPETAEGGLIGQQPY